MEIGGEAGKGRVMTIDYNVIEFEARPIEPPKLTHCEVMLCNNGDLVLTLYDSTGYVAALTYTLAVSPEDFDFEALHEAWGRWRLESPLVS